MAPPLKAEQIFETAIGLWKKRDHARCAQILIEAIKVKPDFPEAFALRGACLLALQQPFDALLNLDRALALNPEADDAWDVWNNRGIAFGAIGMPESAEQCHLKSAALMPAVDPHMLLGGLYCHYMRLEDGEAQFRAALEIDPDLQDAHLKLGVVLLGQGRWAEGFREYDWRWVVPYPPRAFRRFPRWRGEDLNGKAIVLFAEQGYGDEIMSLRFARDVLRRYDCRVVAEVRPTIRRIARTLDGVEVIDNGDPYPPGIDYALPLLDVPALLGVEPDTLNGGPYLSTAGVHGIACYDWGRRVGKLPPQPNVGLCWSSGRRPIQPETERSAEAKSCRLAQFRPLLLDGINFVSLQLPREPIPHDMPIHDWMGDVDDFADTAALIDNLDLVITVDTAVAHLAGAMGKPVWNLVRFNGYWPWLRPYPQAEDGSEPTPWYDSMRVFRQRTLGDWPSVIERVALSLHQFSGRSKAMAAA